VKVTVTPRVEAGTDKGGEDLWLDFEATGDGPLVVELQPGDPSWDEDEDENPGVFSCCTDHYEFEWSGSLLELLKLAEKAGVNDSSNWAWCGPVTKQPQRHWTYSHFVAGNAD